METWIFANYSCSGGCCRSDMSHHMFKEDHMHPIISELNLQPHPEGGYYRQTYCSPSEVRSPLHGEKRPVLTHAYFLLLEGQAFHFHRTAHDQVWHHYDGAPFKLIDLDHHKVREYRLGSSSLHFSSVIVGGHFQAGESMGEYSLLGCTSAPGFNFADFHFLDDAVRISWITKNRPDLVKYISR